MTGRRDGGGARLLDGKALALAMLGEAARELGDLAALRGSLPEIGVVLVGGRPRLGDVRAASSRPRRPWAPRAGSSGWMAAWIRPGCAAHSKR